MLIVNNNEWLLFKEDGRGTLAEFLVRRQRAENSNNPEECK